MSAQTPDPRNRGGDHYGDNNLSPTSLAPSDHAARQMCDDEIEDQEFYKSFPAEVREEVYRCIVFVYDFMEEHSWVKIEEKTLDPTTGEVKDMTFTQLDNPRKDDRISLVQELTHDECRCRLRQLAAAEGEHDFLKQDGINKEIIKNFLCNLLRFFKLNNSFGFTDNMFDIIWSFCNQSCDNCFLISACEFVDLQMQKDLPLLDKFLCLDKPQVARRTMTSENLVDYVVKNKGNSGIEVMMKLFGESDVGARFSILHHSDVFFRGAHSINLNLELWRNEQQGPGYLCFNSTAFNSSTQGIPPSAHHIPCFDAFDQRPVKWISLEDIPEDEEAWLEKQMPARRPRPVDASGKATPSSLSPSSIPGMQESRTLSNSNSFGVPFGNDEVERPSVLESVKSRLVSFLRGSVGREEHQEAEEVDDQWRTLDRTASSPVDTGDGKRHSVVMIGGYDDMDGKTWYLMLNSWKQMPLFLASAECLAGAQPSFACLKKPMTGPPTGFYKRTGCRFTSCASPSVNQEGKWNSYRSSNKDDGFVSGP